MIRQTVQMLGCVLLLLVQIPILQAQEFTSPRATSLGGYVAISDDVYGLDWNVSGQAFSNSRMQMAFTSRQFSGHINNLGLLIRLGARHVFTVRKTPEFFSTVGFSKTPVPQKPEGVTFYDLFSFAGTLQDWAFGYAYKVSSQLSFGMSAKRYLYDMAGVIFSSSRYWSFGFSSTFIVNRRLRFGLVSRNTFSSHYKKHRDRVVLQFQGDPDVTVLRLNLDGIPGVVHEPEWRLDFGAAARPLDNLLVTADIYSDGGYGLGVEWEPVKGLYLRQGISRKSEGLFKPEKISAFAPGVGFRYGAARFDVTFYKSAGRDEKSLPVPAGHLAVSPNTGGDRIWLVSAVFFVK